MKFSRVIPLLFAVLLAGCGQKTAERPQPNLDIATWAAHQAGDGSFTLSLPGEWQVTSTANGEMRFSRGDGVDIVAKAQDARGRTLAQHMTDLSTLRASVVEGQTSVEALQQADVVIGGQNAILREEQLPLAGLKQLSAYVVKNDKAYTFTMYSNDGNLPAPEDETLFHYLLNTISFPSPTAP